MKNSEKSANFKPIMFSVNHLNQGSVFKNQRVKSQIVRIIKLVNHGECV